MYTALKYMELIDSLQSNTIDLSPFIIIMIANNNVFSTLYDQPDLHVQYWKVIASYTYKMYVNFFLYILDVQ